MFLALAMCLSLSALAFAAEETLPVDIQIVDEQYFENGISQIARIEDTMIYYTETTEYTISAEIYPTGNGMAYYKDKSVPNILNVYSIVETDFVDIGGVYDEIVSGRLIPYDTIEVVCVIPDPDIASISNAEVAMVEDALISKYGRPYSDVQQGALSLDGYRAVLYETMEFSISKKISFDVYAGTAVSAIMAITSWPAAIINQVFTIVAIGTGVYGVAKDVTASEYKADVTWYKDVMVGGYRTYYATKLVSSQAFVGDDNAALKKTYEDKHADFDDDYALMKRGIEKYIEFE